MKKIEIKLYRFLLKKKKKNYTLKIHKKFDFILKQQYE